MSELAAKTPRPSSNAHSNSRDNKKNSGNQSDLFIQPKESTNGFLSESSFIQPSVIDQEKEATQPKTEEAESSEATVDSTPEKQGNAEQSNSTDQAGSKKGIFGESAFFQPKAKLKTGIKGNVPPQKEDVEAVTDKAKEVVSDAKTADASADSSSKSQPTNAAQTSQENGESSEGEESTKEETDSSEQVGKEKVEEVPSDTESAKGAKEGEAKGEGKEPKKGKKKIGKTAAFKEVISKVKGTAVGQKQHDPPEQLSGEAQGSALSPANEQTSKAQAGLVDGMDAEAKKPKEFNAEEFKAKLMKRINKMDLPKNLKEADNFKNNNKIDSLNKAALGDVNAQKEATVGNIDQATNQAPNPDAIPPKEVTPLRPVPVGDKPKSVEANKAIPDKRPDSDVKKPVEEKTQTLDDTMAQNEVTDEQLAISEEPSFEKALESKGVAKKDAKSGPAKLRKKEQSALTKNAEKAEGTSQEQLEGMNILRGSAIDKVVGGQQKTAIKDTSERQKIANDINGIFEKTKTDVNKILSDLDKKVASMFKSASTKAKNAFESYCARKMAAYKRKRYSGIIGKGRWLKDKLFSLPDVVNQFYVDGKKRFKSVMESEIGKITNVVALKLNQAKTRVETGKKKVTKYVDDLPANLKKIGKETADDIQDKFDELSDNVDSKQDDLIDTLASEYQASLDEVNARIEEMKEANKGLVDKAMDLVKGVIETIKKLKEVIGGLLSAISSVIPVIIKAPIKFMKNLFSGIGKGIDMFKANIQKHLMGGLLEWLTGSLGPMGIQMPDDIFSLKGIFSLVMQVLGVGWDYLRLKAVKMMGAPVVNALEKGWDVFQNFSKNGVAGIWEYMKDKFSDLKETVMDAIKDMLITKVIEAGIKWLLSLLIPGAGFVKAIMAIKDIIVFFVESAVMLIPAITEAILALAAGSMAGVGKAIELGLSKLISLVIGLFAKLIGLGGLAKKVKKIFKKVRKRVDRAVMKLLLKAKKAGRKLMRKLGIGKDGKKADAKKIKEENKKSKPEKLTSKDIRKHEKYADEIGDALEKGKEKKEASFKDFHQGKRKQAKELENKYQKKLKKGININIKFDPVEKDKKDNDVDFTIIIAPNDTKKKRSALFKGGRVKMEGGFDKLNDYEGTSVTAESGAVFEVHLLTKHGENADLEARLIKDVIREAEALRSARVANLEASLGMRSMTQEQKHVTSEKLSKLKRLNLSNQAQVRAFLNNTELSGKRGKARKIIERISVSKFNSDKIFKENLSKALKQDESEIDEKFGNDAAIGTKYKITFPLDRKAKNSVSGLTLGEGGEFLKEQGSKYKNLTVILVKSKKNPARFVIETAYPSS